MDQGIKYTFAAIGLVVGSLIGAAVGYGHGFSDAKDSYIEQQLQAADQFLLGFESGVENDPYRYSCDGQLTELPDLTNLQQLI